MGPERVLRGQSTSRLAAYGMLDVLQLLGKLRDALLARNTVAVRARRVVRRFRRASLTAVWAAWAAAVAAAAAMTTTTMATTTTGADP